MAKSEKFKALSNEELELLSNEGKKEYKIRLKEYKKSLKPKRSKYAKRMGVLKAAAIIMAIVMILGVIASLIYPLLYLKK